MSKRLLGNVFGFSLMEMMVATAVFSIIAVGGVYLAKWISSSSKLIRTVNDSMLSDISLRSLQGQLERSAIMRSGAVSCTGLTVISGDTQNLSVNLSTGNFSFAYSLNSMVVATDTQNENSLLITGDMKIRVGDLILLKTVDSQGRKGFFKVKKVLRAQQRVEVESADSSTPLPAEIPCQLELAAQGDLINPISPKKFSLDVVEFISYGLAASKQNPKEKSLYVSRYRDFYTSEIVKDFALDRVKSGVVTQRFVKTSNEAGIYRAYVLLKYFDSSGALVADAPDIEKQIQISGGYSFNGTSIYNEYTSASLPINENIFPTCGLSAVPMESSFVDKSIAWNSPGFGDRISVVRLEAVYTESELLTGGLVPAVRARLSPNVTTAEKIRCWTYRDIDWPEANDGTLPVLKRPSLSTAVNFEAMASTEFTQLETTSLVVPVFCSLPVASTITAVLTYSSENAGSYVNKTINCTPTKADATVVPSYNWVYQGPASSCKRESFSIFVGEIISRDGTTNGPALYYDEKSCTWSNSVWSTAYSRWERGNVVYASGPCEFTKLPDSAKNNLPNPRLDKVVLRPKNITVQNAAGATLPLEITCSGGN